MFYMDIIFLISRIKFKELLLENLNFYFFKYNFVI